MIFKHVKTGLGILFVFLMSITLNQVQAQGGGSVCSEIQPFCADEGGLIFPNCNNQDPDCNATAEVGPNYGCLAQQPYPAWFYLRIDQDGDMNFRIIQNTQFDANGNPVGTGLDVDFIAWGPFDMGDDFCDYSLLQPQNEIGCSYSADPIEYFSIPNAQSGQIYVLLITNYERSPGFIKLDQTNAGEPNAGSTDCSIVTADTGCEGETLELDATTPDAINYFWEYDDGTGFVPLYNGDFPTIEVTETGLYRASVLRDSGETVTLEFDILFHPQPIINEPPLDLAECGDGTGVGVFDLTVNDAVVRGGQEPNFQIAYYNTEEDAQTDQNRIANPEQYQITGNLETIWVRITNFERTCYAIDSFEISYEEVTATAPSSPYLMCDWDGTNEASINLEATFSAEILDGQDPLNHFVFYFESLADANSGQNPLAQPYIVVGPSVMIYARVEHRRNSDCFEVVNFEIILNEIPAINETPSPLIICDTDNDGFAPFFLHDADEDITMGNPDLIVTYHPTLLDAQNDLNELPDPYTNDDPWNDIVYARIIDPGTDCYATVGLPLEVRLSPNLTEPEPYALCEVEAGSEAAIFDLTSREEEMLAGADPADFDFYYFVSEYDAIAAGENALENPDFSLAIGNPGNYTNVTNPQTIYVLAVGSANYTAPHNGGQGCYDIVELELIVNALPEPVQLEPYELCDDEESGSTTDQRSIFDLTSRNLEIAGGDVTLAVLWFESYEDEANDLPIATPEAYQNTATPQTVIARVTTPEGCSALITLTLVVNPLPEAVTPEPFIVCDEDGDGYSYFELTDLDDEIAGGNTGVTISYHETELDAYNGTFPLASPYQNIVSGGQTIYARVFYADPPEGTGCFTVVPVTLVVEPSPVLPVEIPDLIACDDGGNEQVVFDLTTHEELIYGTQAPTLLLLTYHRSFEEADEGINAITNPEAFTNETNPQDIFVRLAFESGESCYVIGMFTLIVVPEIAINDPEPFDQCAEVGQPNNERAIFDLTTKNAEITGGAPGIGVRYFLTEEDAQNNTNRIDPETAFENTENPQRVYVRVEDGNTDCVAYTSLLLRVLPNPEPVTPRPLEQCDVDNNGDAEFDLTLREAEILNGENWALGYYETYADAVNQENEIETPEAYTNQTNPQTIYVRVTNEDTGCFEIVELELIVHPIADLNNEIAPYMICEIDTDGLGIFDLTTKIPEILGDLSPDDYRVRFFLSEADAEAGINPVLEPEAHQNRNWDGTIANPQTIYVGIGIPDTDCYVGGLMSFDLIVQEAAIATQPAAPFVICDNLPPDDGIAEFDLEDLTNLEVVALRDEILTGQDPDVYSLTFYETQADAERGENAIVFPYRNVVNPQVIYARVANEENLYEPICHSVVEVILKVNDMPEILFDQDQYRLCVDADGNPIEEEFGELSPPIIDTHLDPNLYTFIWMLNGEVLPGETDAYIIPSQGGTYTVTAIDVESGCVASGETSVWVSSPPIQYGANTIKISGGIYDVEVFADGMGDYEYQLNDGSFQDDNVFSNVELGPGAHYVTIRDKNGCGYVIVELGIIDYPLFFTPNEDGYHDTWNIHGMGVVDPSATIYIFDRYGKLLKQLSPTGEGWDGTYNGKPMPSSDYWFRADYIENGEAKRLKGHFTLKR